MALTAGVNSVQKVAGSAPIQVVEPNEMPPNARADAGIIVTVHATTAGGSPQTGSVFFGGKDVTIANGFRRDPGADFAFELAHPTALWAVASEEGVEISAIVG